MKYLVTSSEMKEYDNNTIEQIGIPGLVLMERAAMAVRDEILKLTMAARGDETLVVRTALYDNMPGYAEKKESCHGKVLIATGSGNNGADGLALARLLAEENFAVSVLECGNPAHATESYKKQREILKFYDVFFLENRNQAEKEYDFVVDGIFGVGLSRPVNETYAEVIQWMNQLRGMKVAIDIPSGIDGTTGQVMGCAFCADVTVTFGFGKRGLYFYPGAEYAGRVVTAQIGINENSFFGHQPEMFTYFEEPTKLLPVRRKDGNKGTFGKVLVIAGWENMAGAAIMSAKAVLKTGAGMVKVFCSEQNRGILQCALPEVMYGSRDSLMQDMKWADVLIAGPGMGQSEEAGEVLLTVLKEAQKAGKPVLLDADALNLIAGNEALKSIFRAGNKKTTDKKFTEKADVEPELVDDARCRIKTSIIMTPHVGELARISGYSISYIKSHAAEVAKEVGLDYDSVMVCKDARTIVYGDGHPLYLNISGNSGMATAGSGDVLSGIIGALLAQGHSAFQAACAGVYLHGLAGDAAAGKYTEYGVTATGIIEQIAEIMKGS